MENHVAGKQLKIAVLIKQIPRFEQFKLSEDGRLVRHMAEHEINPFCRRALGKAIELAREHGGRCIAITMGPPYAKDALVEAIAAGVDQGILISDPKFAGSDTLATSRVLAKVLLDEGPFDLIFCGLNSVDADTGQVGPEVAALLDMAFISGANSLELRDPGRIFARCERDDGWRDVEVRLPAVISAAERLCKPAKADQDQWSAVQHCKIKQIGIEAFRGIPLGTEGSPTAVGSTKVFTAQRERCRITGEPDEVAEGIVEFLRRKAVFSNGLAVLDTTPSADGASSERTRAIGVLIEPGREEIARELLGKAAQLAHTLGSKVFALAYDDINAGKLAGWGADTIDLAGSIENEEDAADLATDWIAQMHPLLVLGPGTSWGREVLSRCAASTGSGLIGDAVQVEVLDGDLAYWKPVFGGQLMARITCSSFTEMATVRTGVLPLLKPRERSHVEVVRRPASPIRGRVRVLGQHRSETLVKLRRSQVVIGIGLGVLPNDRWRLDSLLKVAGAELAATRKVADRGWLPRSSQIGVTGISIAPALYIAIGISGSFNHMVGLNQAGTIVAVNSDEDAPIFDQADLGVVADWRDIVDPLSRRLGDCFNFSVVRSCVGDPSID